METHMQSALIITGISGAEHCAASLSKQLGLPVEVAPSRREGMAALRRREYSIVVIDEPVAEASPEGAELLWKQAGLAIPLQINFAISGTNRLIREVRAALQRRDHEQQVAMRAASTAIENDLRDTVTGLLLHSQLALAEPLVSAPLTAKLQTVAELASNLRTRLENSASQRGAQPLR
ncbi:hypothetical protein D1Y84_05260 [Acidipila sp. EB88]|nr:hypothetical protein D1Y84_05260 [Acidipila sp. EB88]